MEVRLYNVISSQSVYLAFCVQIRTMILVSDWQTVGNFLGWISSGAFEDTGIVVSSLHVDDSLAVRCFFVWQLRLDILAFFFLAKSALPK